MVALKRNLRLAEWHLHKAKQALPRAPLMACRHLERSVKWIWREGR